jgi:hypothetical protein
MNFLLILFIQPFISSYCGLLMFSSALSIEKSTTTTIRQPIRPLPEKILVSYTTRCTDKVIDAVQKGVNVVIWAFVEMAVMESDSDSTTLTSEKTKEAKCISRFDCDCAKKMIAQLDAEGYNNTVNLVSFGGWNGPHLPDCFTAEEIYAAWKDHCGEIFHGVDWDLEGHDDLESPTNLFSMSRQYGEV